MKTRICPSKIRLLLAALCLSIVWTSSAQVWAAPADSSESASRSTSKKAAAAGKSKKGSSGSKSSNRSASTKTTSKTNTKKNEAAGPKAKDRQYREMPLETWTPPDPLVSELGLPIAEGFSQPYPYGNLLRQFNGGKNCRHRGLDIGAVGSVNGGLGTPINAVTRSQVTLIGITGKNVGEFGKLDTREGKAIRSGRSYDRSMYVPGYGHVYLFSRNYGRWRSGTVIVTRVLDGPLKDYTIRYMHMATVRPGLKVGDIVEAGEPIAIMGGTAILESGPHVHIDMENPQKQRRDLAPYIGLPDTSLKCGRQYADKPPVIPKKAPETQGILTPLGYEPTGPQTRSIPREERNPADDLL